MSDASGAKEGGVRYQHLYSWCEMLRLLDEDSPYDWATVEQDGVGAADDVTFHPKPGASAAAQYHQVKWHVDLQSTYSIGNLTAGEAAVFPKLYKGWKKLQDAGHGDVELWLVSNWHADPKTLGKYIDERRELGLKPKFYADGCSAVLAKELGEPSADVEAFCLSLRFRLGFYGLFELEGRFFDERMGFHGLRRGNSARDVARSLVERWVIRGGEEKRVTREDLRQAISQRDLWATAEETPAVRLRIDAFTRPVPDPEATDHRPRRSTGTSTSRTLSGAFPARRPGESCSTRW